MRKIFDDLREKIKEKKLIAPDYPRTPHLKGLSNMAPGDVDMEIVLDFMAYIQEKLDAANCGISWDKDGPILRNREHILRKGYMKDTPAKKQFVPAWNWLYSKEEDIKEVISRWQSPLAIYGEWMWAEHSIGYDNLPDYFMVYDIWSPAHKKFISPKICETLLNGTGIQWVPALQVPVKSFEDIKNILDLPSAYRNGIKEGVVVKITDEKDEWLSQVFKVVRHDFERKNLLGNEQVIKKNSLSK